MCLENAPGIRLGIGHSEKGVNKDGQEQGLKLKSLFFLDYAEEQQNELEALESIYPDEFQIIGDKEFNIAIFPDDQNEDEPLELSLHVKFTPQYPEELPEYDLEVTQGTLTDTQKERITNALKTAGDESLGMAMIFTMASYMKDELNEIIMDGQRALQEVEEEKRRKEEEAEQAKFRGTRVTIERFMEWKKKYDQERAAMEDQEKIQRAKELKNKLTGRQLFEQDRSLAQSDAKYMEEDDALAENEGTVTSDDEQ
ncbi:RWD domain-containing protein 1 [Apophysomyces sp. BC1034]|nr:RWD domain-containing protein 1 [Apophysomyces sp. BC1015]KAG0168415.1 RWD domain-containing protein 1 [Apophysomyces sp. BC1021]KAG0185226.1 RWD domain-containing protein 1 [Apophysomyces sp. BC1034]